MENLEYSTSENIYAGGAFFDVVEAVTQYRGQEYVSHVVRHPGGVGVVPLLGRGAVCVEQYRPAVGKVLLEIPAGRPIENEAPAETGIRELWEETGLRATQLIPLIEFYPAPCFCDGLCQVFVTQIDGLTTYVEQDGQLPTSVKVVPLDALEQYMSDGLLVDAKSIVALMAARYWLQAKKF